MIKDIFVVLLPLQWYFLATKIIFPWDAGLMAHRWDINYRVLVSQLLYGNLIQHVLTSPLASNLGSCSVVDESENIDSSPSGVPTAT